MPSLSLPSWLSYEVRNVTRLPIEQTVTISGRALAKSSAVLLDVSTLGCKVAFAGNVAMGAYVSLHMPDGEAIEGWVAWSKLGRVGVDFARPISRQRVAYILSLEADASRDE